VPTLLTHAVVGASVAVLRRSSVKPAKLAIVAALLAVLPDIDVIGFRFGIAYGDMLGHRGFTHSLVFAAIAGVLAALALFPEVKRGSRDSWYLACLLAVATASHGLLDAFTDAGLGIGFFIPFDDSRYFAPWRPLAASPLSIVHFFEGRGLSILLNELKWIGLPLGAFVGCVLLVRKAR